MNWNAFKRLFHYLGRYKLRLILVMIAAVLSTLFTVLTPAVTGGITSELYDGVASGSFDWETIVWLLVTLIALYLVAQLFAILQSFSMTKLTACVMETLRGDIDRKMHHLKLDYYDSHTQGEILSTITNDVDTVNNALSQNLTQIVTQVVTAVGILVMMFTTVNPSGVIAGFTEGYNANGLPVRGLTQLAEGDELIPLYPMRFRIDQSFAQRDHPLIFSLNGILDM